MHSDIHTPVLDSFKMTAKIKLTYSIPFSWTDSTNSAFLRRQRWTHCQALIGNFWESSLICLHHPHPLPSPFLTKDERRGKVWTAREMQVAKRSSTYIQCDRLSTRACSFVQGEAADPTWKSLQLHKSNSPINIKHYTYMKSLLALIAYNERWFICHSVWEREEMKKKKLKRFPHSCQEMSIIYEH